MSEWPPPHAAPEPTYGPWTGWNAPGQASPSNGSEEADSTRRHRRAMVTLAVFAGIVLLLAGVSAGVVVSRNSSSNSDSSAGSLVNQAVAAAKSAGSFRYVAVSQQGSSSQSTVGTAQQTSGLQSITVQSPAYGTEKFSLVLLGGVVYFRGNSGAVQDQLGVQASSSAKHANQWISLHSSDAPYDALEAGMTTDSTLSQVLISPRSASQVSTAHGTVWRVKGIAPASQQENAQQGTAEFDLAESSKLPVYFTSTQSAGGQQMRSSFTFSRWGEQVTINAPKHSVPYSSLGVTSGSSAEGGGDGAGGTSGGGNGTSGGGNGTSAGGNGTSGGGTNPTFST